jgi:hypothetical protein
MQEAQWTIEPNILTERIQGRIVNLTSSGHVIKGYVLTKYMILQGNLCASRDDSDLFPSQSGDLLLHK